MWRYSCYYWCWYFNVFNNEIIMIDVVINYDLEKNEYKIYEPTTDTILITTSLGETFIKLDEFLKQNKLITTNILNTEEVNYHLDSMTFIALVKSNVDLLKRLNTAPSGFTTSSQRFGQPTSSFSKNKKSDSNFDSENKSSKNRHNYGTFSKTSFRNSGRKFGGYN